MERGGQAYPLSVRKAGEADLPLLARFNRALIEDEGSRNPMTLDELAARMAEFLKEGWLADLFCRDGEVLGYALYQIDRDGYEDAPFVYIRQFLIVKEYRRQGFGLQAVEYLIKHAFPPGAIVSLDVLQTNAGGHRFWEKAGFSPYYTNLKRWPGKTGEA
ncbi:MAG TPA: GNAT family N-acetyltransferase [Feifaniaceae bacterium]|nr:GNAT family N-acetyltransferase [Feifaniaceae bacterium]